LFISVRSLAPDIITVTGDVVSRSFQKNLNKPYTVRLAQELVKIAPVFFTTGNHEKRLFGEMLPILMREGVEIATGKMSTLVIRGNTVHIAGMHDISIERNFHRNAAVFEHLNEGYNIFLSHRPEHYLNLMQYNIDLLLCGHTHAGQVRFPVFGTFFMPGQGLFPKYLQGGFVNQNTTMIISRGLGSSGYPAIRINNPPEMVCISLEALN
ncbi:MAG: metallophosphoesterase, partial [Eubacteriales bacterium]